MRYILSVLCFCGICFASLTTAHAAPIATGITVSPAIEQISLSQNQSSATYATQITNNTTAQVVISISAEDFTALNQTGSISFYNSNQLSSNNPHGLLNYLSIAYPEVALQPGQSQTVPVTILNANKLAAGGHYAALLFKVSHLASAKGNRITINQVVSSLVFLSTYGQGTQSVTLTTPVTGSLLTTLPQVINAVFVNTGNTQTAPRGYLQILDSSSRIVSQGQINTDSSLILPQSKRLFGLNLIQTKRHLWPGVYLLKIYYRHDGQTTYSVYEQKFLFVNQSIIAVNIAVLLALALLAGKFISSKFGRLVKSKPSKSKTKIPIIFE